MRRLRALVVTTALMLGSLAHGASMVAVDVEEQALDSTAVVLAEVASNDAITTPTRAYLDTRLKVKAVLAGEAPSELNIRQVGGVHGGRKVAVPGDAELPVGGRVVAFIRKVDGRWYLTALSQSVWHVHGQGRTAQVYRDIRQVTLYERGPEGELQAPTQSLPDYTTYGELVDAVRDLPMGQP